MRQATVTFTLDNGTIAEGQIVPDDHLAVQRFPGNFTSTITTPVDFVTSISGSGPGDGSLPSLIDCGGPITDTGA